MVNSSGEVHQRARLMREIGSLTDEFEMTALPTLLEPLLSTELTIQQLKVLTVLVTSEDGAAGRGLSEMFGVSMASMSGLLDRLVSQGVATRSEDPRDHRVRKVRATPLGRTIVRRLVASRPEFNASILAGLPLEDLHALAQGMRAVGAELRRFHARAGDRGHPDTALDQAE